MVLKINWENPSEYDDGGFDVTNHHVHEIVCYLVH